MLREKWEKIEKVYLYKIPYGLRQNMTAKSLDETLLIVMIYQKTISGRWIAIYSSAMAMHEANYYLRVIRHRLLSQKGKIQEGTLQPQLQKPDFPSFRLQIPPGEEIFVIDTNILYENNNFCSFNLSQKTHTILITSPVLRELDRLKMIKNSKDKSIAISKTIYSLFRKGTDITDKKIICKGKIRLLLFVFEPDQKNYISGFDKEITDDRLIMTAKAILEANPQNPVIVLTQDINVLLKCKAIHLKAIRLNT